MLKKVYSALLLVFVLLTATAQDRKTQWVDSVLQQLSVPEKIGQLFMVPVSSYWSGKQAEAVEEMITDYHAGSIYVMNGGPKSQADMMNRLQRLAKVPVMAGLEAQWGLGQTLDSVISFPRPMAVGAIRDDSMIYQLGKTVARQMKMLGLQINFGPRVDLYRTGLPGEFYFSDERPRVINRSLNLIRGLQSEGVKAVAKQSPTSAGNLPGVTDSIAYFDLSQMDTSEVGVHIQLIHNWLGGLLTSNFNFTMQSKKRPEPAAVSSVFINEILKNKIGFTGMTFTEIPVLQRIVGKKRKGETEFLAFLVGNDILIAPQNPGPAIKKIKKAVSKDPSLLNQLNASVRKILGAKYDAGLAESRFVNTDNLVSRINSPEAKLFQHRLAEASVTVVKNDAGMIPLQTIEGKRFVLLSLGENKGGFGGMLSKYAPLKKFTVRSAADTVSLADSLQNADVIMVAFFNPLTSFPNEVITAVKKMTAQKEVILCDFGNPENLESWDEVSAMLEAYHDDELMSGIAAQIIFGGIGASGVLPITLPSLARAGSGIITKPYDRLQYTVPEAAGMDSRTLEGIKAIAAEAIAMKATPGCRVLVARNGKVIYNESFGTLTYDSPAPVTTETLYDLASLTKVSATLQTVMFMHEKGLIDINKKLSVYLPELKGTDKEDFIIKDILTHQAGLWPFLPFWLQTLKDSTYMPEYYSHEFSPDYPYPVSEGLFVTKTIKDSLWQWIVHAKIVKKVNRAPYTYRYSDMAFYMMQHLAEKILSQPMEDFLDQNIYEPLGASTLGFLPRRKFPASRIAPTEYDKSWRKSLLVGYVHDQGSALYGGVAGHAGLFGTADDLAKLSQMWLQKGTYGGQRYFKPETLDFFTQKQYETSRRGLGWDRPVHSDPDGPTSYYASQKTFGHTGFTGTCIWVDPEFDLVFIFLSNRVYPDMTNNKILNANIRPRIQDLLYRSIFTYCERHK